MPRWYRLIEAARYLGTTPWELEDKPWRYVLQAEEAQASMQHARDKLNPRPQQ